MPTTVWTITEIVSVVGLVLTIAGVAIGFGRQSQKNAQIRDDLDKLAREHLERTKECPLVTVAGKNLSEKLEDLNIKIDRLDDKSDQQSEKINQILGYLNSNGKIRDF